jgi:hypothetical protein
MNGRDGRTGAHLGGGGDLEGGTMSRAGPDAIRVAGNGGEAMECGVGEEVEAGGFYSGETRRGEAKLRLPYPARLL